MNAGGTSSSGSTARAIWSAVIGVGVASATIAAGLDTAVGIAVGAGAAAVFALAGRSARRRSTGTTAPRIDPFTVGEPWRQHIMQAQRAARRVETTVRGCPAGPLRNRLRGVAEQVEHGLAEVWRIARRGDEIDAAVDRMSPTDLRRRLEIHDDDTSSRIDEGEEDDGPDHGDDPTIESLRAQLAAAERLQARSRELDRTLRVAGTRLDELAVRSTEIAVGAGDTEAYEHDVDDLVIELESLRLAAEEVRDT